jgi:hypothetical protein
MRLKIATGITIGRVSTGQDRAVRWRLTAGDNSNKSNKVTSACQIMSAAESRIPDWAAEHRGGNVPFCIRGSLKRIVGHFAGEDLFIGLVDCLLIHDTDPSFSPPLRRFQI